MRFVTVIGLSLALTCAASASPIEEVRVRAETAVRDAQICCNRIDDGYVPGEAPSPCRRELKKVADAYAAGLRAMNREELASARDAFEDTMLLTRRLLKRFGRVQRR